MGLVEHTEVELKFEAAPDLALPDLPAGLAVSAPVVADLSATYFDTVSLALSRAKITLRRRTGGGDEGWHLKLPAQAGARTEVQLPLTESLEPPAELLERVRVLVRDHPLRPVARIDNHRTTVTATAPDGVAELCDDLVTATSLLAPDGGPRQWREWELELVSGSPAVLGGLSAALLAAGATASASPSKLARAIGPLPPAGNTTPPPGTAAELLLGVLRKHVATLHAVDPQVRADLPDSVHQFRVTVRRVRSVLRCYKPLLDPGVMAPFDAELQWLATTMGDARDSEVMAERLAAIIDGMPDGTVPPELREHLVGAQQERYRAAHADAVASLGTTRYFRLLDRLDEVLAAPPFTARADAPAEEAVAAAMRTLDRQMRRTDHGIRKAKDAEHRDELLHSLRKQAKRLRYAGEVYAGTTPAPGHQGFHAAVSAAAGAAKTLQETLGEHQDGVITQALLRSARRGRPASEKAAFTALIAHEKQLAKAARTRYAEDMAAVKDTMRGVLAAQAG